MESDYPQSFQLKPAVQQFVREHMRERKLRKAEMARALGFSETRISKYLNLKPGEAPENDMPRVQNAAQNFMRQHERKTKLAKSLHDCDVSKAVGSALRQIRRTGEVGVIHGANG